MEEGRKEREGWRETSMTYDHGVFGFWFGLWFGNGLSESIFLSSLYSHSRI